AWAFASRADYQLGCVLGGEGTGRLAHLGPTEALAPMNMTRPMGLLTDQRDLGTFGHRDLPRAAGDVEHPERVASRRGGGDVAENGGYATYLDRGVGQQGEERHRVIDP